MDFSRPTQKIYFAYSRKLAPHCKGRPGEEDPDSPCADSGFLSDLCALYPLQVTKLVRLRASLAGELLEDRQLDARKEDKSPRILYGKSTCHYIHVYHQFKWQCNNDHCVWCSNFANLCRFPIYYHI